VSDAQRLLDELVRQLTSARAPDPLVVPTETNGRSRAPASAPVSVSDEDVITWCRHAANAPKFTALYDYGDVHTYHDGDDSRADLGLLGILKLYTKDPVQLERLFDGSALARRDKWRARPDYRERTIAAALKDVGGPVVGGGPAAQPLIGQATGPPPLEGADPPALTLVRFSDRPPPKPREFLVAALIPRGYPTTLYGWGGTAKSLLALYLGLTVTAQVGEFFGRTVAVHGPVLYLDFELDADEQHRRVEQLTAGMGMKEVPDDLLYITALGIRTNDAIAFALNMCKEHGVVLIILDSLGPAMVGDMSAAKDVIEFHNSYIAPFKKVGATPILVDHQARQQTGEGYQSKGAFGSAYKEHLSRSLIQVERGDQGADDGTLNVRLRHKKTNFGALVDPFDVALQFSDEKITASVLTLTPADRAQETTLNSRERVIAALEDGPAYPDEIAETTGLPRSTVKNAVTALKKAGRVETTGELRDQKERVCLVAQVARPIKRRATRPLAGGGSRPLTDQVDRRVQRLMDEGVAEDVAKALVAGAVPEFFE
jgi:DNA-binding transcriptional ArsR family regulator